MEQQGQFAKNKLIESFFGWWELAGVDAAVTDRPVDWLAIDARAEAAVVLPARVKAKKPFTPAKPDANWPAQIEMLKAMSASGALLPGNDFGPGFVTPVGPASAEIMVISDMPDEDELAAGTLGSGATGVLLTRMLAAIGINLADCYWTALATTIPPTAEVPENAIDELAAFVRHQIGLVRPKWVIVLGSSACKALLGEELMKARVAIRNINHEGANIAVLTTFHPRRLIARPTDKRQAWKDLQMFAKRADL